MTLLLSGLFYLMVILGKTFMLTWLGLFTIHKVGLRLVTLNGTDRAESKSIFYSFEVIIISEVDCLSPLT